MYLDKIIELLRENYVVITRKDIVYHIATGTFFRDNTRKYLVISRSLTLYYKKRYLKSLKFGFVMNIGVFIFNT